MPAEASIWAMLEAMIPAVLAAVSPGIGGSVLAIRGFNSFIKASYSALRRLWFSIAA